MLTKNTTPLKMNNYYSCQWQWRRNHGGGSGPGLTTFWSELQVRVVIHGVNVELFLELLLMLLVLVSHDVQNGISYDFDFVRWPLHFEFPLSGVWFRKLGVALRKCVKPQDPPLNSSHHKQKLRNSRPKCTIRVLLFNSLTQLVSSPCDPNKYLRHNFNKSYCPLQG